MSYSSKISYVLDKLQGFSTNTFKMMPAGSTEAVANSIINVTLPANTLVNMRSFALHFTAAITSANDEGRLPNNISSLIERYEVKIGGTQVFSGCNAYNALVNAKAYLGCHKVCPLTEHPEVVVAKSAYTTSGTDGITSSLEVANDYAITNWDGFLGTCEPAILDNGLVGDVQISFYLAPNSVCIDASAAALAAASIGTAAASPNPVYKLTNIYATVECVSFADGTYDAMTSQIISSKGFLEIPFKNFKSFEDSVSQSMRFQIAASSLDKIWVIHRADNYSTAGGGVLVSGYLTSTSANATSYDTILGYNKQKVISKYFNYAQPAAGFTSQFQLNGSLIPQWNANITDWAVITKNSLPADATHPEWSMLTYKNNYCVYCLRLNLPNSEKERIISGLNTLGISLNAFYNMTGVASSKNIAIFCEHTSILRVGAGHQLEVQQ